MIIHSVVPLETVFEGIDKERPKTKEIDFNGLLMEVEPLNESEAKIVRLISPRAADYLDARWAPGQVIRFFPGSRG